MLYIYFYLPFLVLSLIFVSIIFLTLRRFKLNSRMGYLIVSIITALVFAFFGIGGAKMVLAEHFIPTMTTTADLIGVYKVAGYGVVYGILMGILLFRLSNKFVKLETFKLESTWILQHTLISILISVGLFYVSFYYMMWVII